MSEEAELPHATQSLPAYPTASSTALKKEDNLTDLNLIHVQHTFHWRSLLLRRLSTIWQLIIAAFKTVAAVPVYIITVVNGTRWRQSRIRQKVII